MNTFKTGVHTIEFQTAKYLRLSDLPEKYSGAVSQVDGMRYKLTLPKVQGVSEYSSPADTQRDIEEAFAAFSNMDVGYPKTTRIDFRLDDHEGAYVDHLQLMTVLVNIIAAMGDIYDRRVFYTDGNHVITSVRCMPDKKDKDARYGVEYYDKPKQAKTDEYGNARLELRRLNMENERVQFVIKEWSDMLKSITKRKYLAVLEAHAQSMFASKPAGETVEAFIKRARDMMIAREEWNIVCRLIGKRPNHYERLPSLPRWEDVKPFIDDLTAQLDEALSQPHSSSQHPKQVTNELPF